MKEKGKVLKSKIIVCSCTYCPWMLSTIEGIIKDCGLFNTVSMGLFACG